MSMSVEAVVVTPGSTEKRFGGSRLRTGCLPPPMKGQVSSATIRDRERVLAGEAPGALADRYPARKGEPDAPLVDEQPVHLIE